MKQMNALQKLEQYVNMPSGSADLEEDIRTKVMGILSGKTASDNFYGNLLDHITAYPDRRMEVHLKFLPTKWSYVLNNLTTPQKGM